MKKSGLEFKIKPGKLSREELDRMFMNKPLEPYIESLSRTADFSPIFAELDQYFAELRTEICGLLEDSLRITDVLRAIAEKKFLKISGVTISNQDNLSVLNLVLRDLIVQNFTKALKKIETNCDYEDIINENFVMTSDILLNGGVVCYNVDYEGLYGGIHLIEDSPDALKEKIRQQISEIKDQIKESDFVWINQVLKTLVSNGANFTNRLFQDIYDFCEAEGFISEVQLKMHESNNRPTAKLDYIRSAYNRLTKTAAYEAIIKERK